MKALGMVCRVIAAIGLGSIGCLHLLWATGSSWPAQSRAELGEMVAGTERMPPGAPTVVVGIGLIGAGIVTSGAAGESRRLNFARVAVGSILLMRGALGGVVAARALRLGETGERFQRVDRVVYRPLCAVLGAAAIGGALTSRLRESRQR